MSKLRTHEEACSPSTVVKRSGASFLMLNCLSISCENIPLDTSKAHEVRTSLQYYPTCVMAAYHTAFDALYINEAICLVLVQGRLFTGKIMDALFQILCWLRVLAQFSQMDWRARGLVTLWACVFTILIASSKREAKSEKLRTAHVSTAWTTRIIEKWYSPWEFHFRLSVQSSQVQLYFVQYRIRQRQHVSVLHDLCFCKWFNFGPVTFG